MFGVVQILELIFSYEIPTPLHISILGLRSGEARGSGGGGGGGDHANIASYFYRVV